MVAVNVVHDFSDDADKLWSVIADFGSVDWIEGPERVDVIGSGVGMIRRMVLTGMDPIDEKLESLDDASRTLSYSIAKNAVIPFDNYLAVVKVVPQAQGGCQVDWGCTLDAGDMPAADAQAIMQGAYENMLTGLASYLQAR